MAKCSTDERDETERIKVQGLKLIKSLKKAIKLGNVRLDSVDQQNDIKDKTLHEHSGMVEVKQDITFSVTLNFSRLK